MNDGVCTAARTFAASAPVAVLQAGSFSSTRVIPCLRQLLGSLAQFVIHRGAVRSLIVQSPEIKAANAISTECFRHADCAVQNFVLLLEGKVCAERSLFAVLRLGRAWPVGLEQRAGNVGDFELDIFRECRWASATSFSSRLTMFFFHMPRSSIQCMPNSREAMSQT